MNVNGRHGLFIAKSKHKQTKRKDYSFTLLAKATLATESKINVNKFLHLSFQLFCIIIFYFSTIVSGIACNRS